MTHFLNTLRCTISTLSPIHIGCGEDYYPTNYVMDGRFLHHFSQEGLLAALTDAEKNRLAEISDEQGDSGIIKLQQFIHDKKEKLQRQSTHSVPVSAELEAFYLSRIGKVAQRETNGRKIHNRLEIARHAFNPYNQTPYFAGSSIKGAIRTALLNALNQGDPLPMRLDINRDAPRGSGDQLQKKILGYQAISDNPVKGIKGDPLRLLKISDAIYSHTDNLHASEIRFAVNRKNKPSKFEAKGLNQLLECMPANRSRGLAFDMTFLADQFSHYRWTLRDICIACNEFFVPQLEKELDLLQKLNHCDTLWAKGLEKLLANELAEAFREHKAFLLRVGQHGGAESNTLEGVRHIKIMQGKGNAPKYLDKPTTIWLAANHKDEQHDLLPFGWVLVEIGDFKLNHIHEFIKIHAEKDYVLAAQRAEFLEQEQQKREKQAQQEAENLERERLAELAQAQKAAQMATLSDEQKLIFELQSDFEKEPKCKANGTLHQKLVGVIKQAENWSPDDKHALFEFGTMLWELWSKPKKLKDQLKSLQS